METSRCRLAETLLHPLRPQILWNLQLCIPSSQEQHVWPRRQPPQGKPSRQWQPSCTQPFWGVGQVMGERVFLRKHYLAERSNSIQRGPGGLAAAVTVTRPPNRPTEAAYIRPNTPGLFSSQIPGSSPYPRLRLGSSTCFLRSGLILLNRPKFGKVRITQQLEVCLSPTQSDFKGFYPHPGLYVTGRDMVLFCHPGLAAGLRTENILGNGPGSAHSWREVFRRMRGRPEGKERGWGQLMEGQAGAREGRGHLICICIFQPIERLSN